MLFVTRSRRRKRAPVVRLVSIPAFGLIVCAASMASAQHRGPTPEALEACEGRSVGASCSVETPHGALEGTCEAPEGRALACRPAHPPGPPPDGAGPREGARRGPPPGAIEACEGIAEGDACVLDAPHGTVEGVCRSGPDGNACVPPATSRGSGRRDA